MAAPEVFRTFRLCELDEQKAQQDKLTMERLRWQFFLMAAPLFWTPQSEDMLEVQQDMREVISAWIRGEHIEEETEKDDVMEKNEKSKAQEEQLRAMGLNVIKRA